MLFKQFCRLAFSFLIGVTPINFEIASDPLSFPLTRTDSIQYKISLGASDLGKINDNSENHIYLVTEHVDISCSSACSLANASFAYSQPSESQIEFNLSFKTDAMTPNEFSQTLTILNSTQAFSEAHTYDSENSSFIWRLVFPIYGGRKWTLSVFFPAVNDGLIQRSTNYLVDEFSNLYFAKEYLINAVDNKVYPSSVMSEYIRLINNGQYAEAVTYITNYNVSNVVSENNENSTTINAVDDSKDNFSTLSNNLNTIENGYNNDLNDQLNDIDFSYKFENENSFLSSSNFVITVFNGLIRDNPLSGLIILSSILGIAAFIIGRRK